MHINMSLFKDGKNAFCDESDPRGLSSLAYNFIAGLLEHVQGFCAVTNPLINSYKRLNHGLEAPCCMTWSTSNRSSLVRIPDSRGQSTRIELRNPDPTCNPYLAFAVCLAAGLDGIERGLTPPQEVRENIYEMDPAVRAARGIEFLPETLKDSINAMMLDHVITDALGPHVTSHYVAGKQREWINYCAQISQWELDNYLIIY
jgi:glutamine synthetase